MLIKKAADIKSSGITPKSIYIDRRKFLAGVSAAPLMAGHELLRMAVPSQSVLAGSKLDGVGKGPFGTDEKQTAYKDVTHYNNFYEFSTRKGGAGGAG